MKVIYLMSGASHIPYLLVSLASLREHYDGTVEVYAWEESYEYVRIICQDKYLNASSKYRIPIKEFRHSRKNNQGMDRISLVGQMNYDEPVIYLDADTVVAGPLDELFSAAAKTGYAATQFIHWTTQQGIIKRRLERLREIGELNQGHVEELITETLPSLNCGVFAAVPSRAREIHDSWGKWCYATRGQFIADETTQHLLMVDPRYRDQIAILDGRFNCSARFKYLHKDYDRSTTVVWHGHGDCFTRTEKAEEWREAWKDLWRRCYRFDIGGAQIWGGDCMKQHKYLKQCSGYVGEEAINAH